MLVHFMFSLAKASPWCFFSNTPAFHSPPCSTRHFFSSLGVILSLPWPQNGAAHQTQCKMWCTWWHKCLRWIAPVTKFVSIQMDNGLHNYFQTREYGNTNWGERCNGLQRSINFPEIRRRSSQHQKLQSCDQYVSASPPAHVDKTQATRGFKL